MIKNKKEHEVFTCLYVYFHTEKEQLAMNNVLHCCTNKLQLNIRLFLTFEHFVYFSG